MNEILDHPIQQGDNRISNNGYDIAFDHVGFAYNAGETVLKDVSFTAKQGEMCIRDRFYAALWKKESPQSLLFKW